MSSLLSKARSSLKFVIFSSQKFIQAYFDNNLFQYLATKHNGQKYFKHLSINIWGLDSRCWLLWTLLFSLFQEIIDPYLQKLNIQ